MAYALAAGANLQLSGLLGADGPVNASETNFISYGADFLPLVDWSLSNGTLLIETAVEFSAGQVRIFFGMPVMCISIK